MGCRKCNQELSEARSRRPGSRGSFKARYVKNDAEYRKVSFESAKIKAAMKRAKEPRKQPTSVALDPQLIEDLKTEAKARGVPYQVLMRMFIVDGFKRLKRAG